MQLYLFLASLIIYITPVFAEIPPSPIAQLSKKFHDSYLEAVDNEKDKLASCPMITQDLLSMTLHTSIGMKPIFTMKKDLYKTLAEISHIPMVIHNIAAKYDWQFSSNLSTELFEYLQLLQEAYLNFEKSDLELTLKGRIKEIMGISNKYITYVLLNKSINTQGFSRYSLELRPLLDKNLVEGAKTQIEQFHTQIQIWKKQYPDEHWQCLKIAILGSHEPREGYVLKQYFQWLLKEPSYEKNVIYVEFPDLRDIFSDPSKSTAIAINALINGSYQQKFSANFRGNSGYMQRDVMADAASKILKSMKENKS
ncbi:MAG: hypothetical protein H0U73_05905 [Tatlockia sp.]|nr:hypothetical protein [Tatlockia sp.]